MIMTDLLPRIKSLILFVPPLLLGAYFGGWLLLIITFVAVQLAAREMERLLQLHTLFAVRIGLSLGLLGGLVDAPLVYVAYPLLLFELVPTALRASDRADWSAVVQRLSAAALTMLYLGLILFWPALRALPAGREAMIWTIVIVWASDTGAYLLGSRFGRGGLMPGLSPKKSWIGALSGLALAALIGGAAAVYWMPEFRWAAIVAAGIAAFAQVGDLFESMLKRSAGAKDSGHMFPGHGGLLDRIDSLLFAIPVTYVLVYAGVIF